MRWKPSMHFSSRRGATIRWIVLHADVSPKESATENWICSPDSRVSYHIFVHRDGSLTRFVTDDMAAWACGKSVWGKTSWLNPHSLSLAFASRHDKKERLTDGQIAAAMGQVEEWRARHPTIEAVLTHAMISPRRKPDPHLIPNFNLADYA